VALANNHLFPINPERLVEWTVRPIFDELAAVLEEVAAALEGASSRGSDAHCSGPGRSTSGLGRSTSPSPPVTRRPGSPRPAVDP
jgi:hypothetical protein